MQKLQTVKIWLVTHKLVTVLILIIGYLLYRSTPLNNNPPMFRQNLTADSYQNTVAMGSSAPAAMMEKQSTFLPPQTESGVGDVNIAPANRKVSKNYSMSLLVSDAKKAITDIQAKAESFGGFVISSGLSNPAGEAYGSLNLRVPAVKAAEFSEYLRKTGRKVLYENVNSQDLTEQYTDVEARMALLTENKTRFEEIMRKATEVQDILNVQREVFGLQEQIDSLKGQMKYIEEVSGYSLFDVSIATTDSTLPQNPNARWSLPGVFEEAINSLKSIGLAFTTAIVWIAVFSIIWIPLLVIYVIVKKMQAQKAGG